MKSGNGEKNKFRAGEILMITAGGCIVGLVFNAIFGTSVMDPGGILGGLMSAMLLLWLT